MEPIRLWAAVRFCAQNGDPEALLTLAAQQGLHLSRILTHPGGFCAQCAAWDYLPLAALARRQKVRLRIEQRLGLYFRLRPLLHRTGLWVGALLFTVLLLWAQGLVWAADYHLSTTGQIARAAEALRSVGLQPGAFVTEEKLRAGEYALLQSGEFSWASVNFSKGRLEIEAAAATPKPDIASGSAKGIRAKCAGTVVETNLVSGTMLVSPGQQVESGDGLISTARSERDGTLIFSTAAGSVRAKIQWGCEQQIELERTVLQRNGGQTVALEVFFADKTFVLPTLQTPENAAVSTRHLQVELWGLPLPCSMIETTYYAQTEQTIYSTEQQALTLARLQSEQALYAAFADAEILAQKEDCHLLDETLYYTTEYTFHADICQ